MKSSLSLYADLFVTRANIVKMNTMFPSSTALEAITLNSKRGVLIHDIGSLRILWANQSACDYFQYSLEELRALKAHHMSSQDVGYRREDAVTWLHSAALYGSNRKKWRYQAADGTYFLVEAIASSVELDGHRVILVEFHVIDESRQETGLQQWASDTLDRIVTHTASGVLVLDTENRVERASPLAARLFNVNSSQIVGRLFHTLGVSHPPMDSPEVSGPLHDRHGSVSLRMQIESDTADKRWLAATLENIVIEGTQYRVVTARDISDRVEAERKQAAQQAQLQYLSRYNAMGDMAMILAHELGQPLAASLNYLSGLKSRANAADFDPAVLRYGVQKIQKQLQRASAIVSSVKRYVRKIESTASPMSLSETVEESLYFVRLRAEEFDVEVHTELGSDPLAMNGEEILIGQVVINLCMNAIDEIRHPDTTTKELHIHLSRHGDFARLSVSDYGRGLTEFSPDQRLAAGAFSSKEDSSGIGLIISEHIVQRHGGTIEFSPNIPKGTVANLILPLK